MNTSESKKKKKKPWNLQILAMSGGGIRAATFLGILKILSDKIGKDFYKQIPVMTGSSAGALICTSFHLGFNVDEIIAVFYEHDFRRLVPSFYYPQEVPDHRMSKSLIKNYGLDSGDALNDFLDMMIRRKGYDPTRLTFYDLYRESGQTLVVTGAHMNSGECVYYSWSTTPDTLIATAMKITCRIPVMFVPWSKGDDLYVDGNLFDPFPVRKLTKFYRKEAKRGNLMGIIEIVDFYQEKIEELPTFFWTLLRGIKKQFLHHACERYKKKIIILDSKDPGHFDASKEEIRRLVDAGLESGRSYFKKRGFPGLVKRSHPPVQSETKMEQSSFPSSPSTHQSRTQDQNNTDPMGCTSVTNSSMLPLPMDTGER